MSEEHGQDAHATPRSSGLACNLLVAGEVIEEMARRKPATFNALKRALAAGSVSLVGGEMTERSLPLLNPETMAQHLARGLAVYQECCSSGPSSSVAAAGG